MRDRQLFRCWVRQLRRLFPSRYPVRVLLVSPEQVEMDYGECSWNEDQTCCTLRIADNRNESETKDTLLHEWAHCLREHLPVMPGDADHDALFATILGRIYQAHIGEV